MMSTNVRGTTNKVLQESPMSVLLRRVCTVALIASVAGMGLMASGCHKGADAGSEETVVDSTPVIVGLSVVRTGGTTTIGYVATPEGEGVEIAEVEITSTEKDINLADSGTITKTVWEDLKANPTGYVLVVDEAKKINVVAKAK
jgi:hypothetical protein